MAAGLVLIPAYNEAPRIGEVLRAAARHAADFDRLLPNLGALGRLSVPVVGRVATGEQVGGERGEGIGLLGRRARASAGYRRQSQEAERDRGFPSVSHRRSLAQPKQGYGQSAGMPVKPPEPV